MVATAELDQQRVESLGPAERIIQNLTSFIDHIVHNRTGFVSTVAQRPLGVLWEQAAWVEKDGVKTVYTYRKVGSKSIRTEVGTIDADGKTVRRNGQRVGEFRDAGIFPEAAAHAYREAAEVWKMDNEFAARWASWAHKQKSRDLKVLLAALMLVQNRCGAGILGDNGKPEFRDDDYREVGEALILRGKDFTPKIVSRVQQLLSLPEIAEINRELGFGRSARTAPMGRFKKAAKAWLRRRELNVPMLKGLVKAGMTRATRRLARTVGYKPMTDAFYGHLRWKQKQAKDGRRTIGIGKDVAKAESWKGLNEREICERIVGTKPSYLRATALLGTSGLGMTRAIMASLIEARSLSDKDLIILTPTLEELGLLQVPDVKDRWLRATQAAEDHRAANIAKNVRSVEAKEGLQAASDKAVVKAFEEAARDLTIWVIVDKSSSMQAAIERSKALMRKFVHGFPPERTKISIFNTIGREITLKSQTAAGVEQAFRGHTAGGGTSYTEGVRVLFEKYGQPKDTDLLLFFIGDEGDCNGQGRGGTLAHNLQQMGLKPVAFALLPVFNEHGRGWMARGQAVTEAAQMLEIPCFEVQENVFEDPYAITQTLANLIKSTPVATGGPVIGKRVSLIEEILATDLLQKPLWA